MGGFAMPFGGLIKNMGTNPRKTFTFDGDWNKVRKAYQLRDYINLENGYYNILPTYTLEYQIDKLKELNDDGSYYMRKYMPTDKQRIREAMAQFLQVPVEELIITRNTTESLDTIISGYPWQKGDEAIMARQEYGSMLDMFKQQARRFGIVNTFLDIPLHPSSDEEIVDLYRKAITPRTKMILVSHMINITGHILPIRKICDMAHEHGVKVLVDGAHAIAHFVFKISDLNCDYYGASLHKWLSVPLGAGILYVKKENISEIWPLFGEAAYADTDIRKLNHTGTIPMHIEKSIPFAIQFYNTIGGECKEERLRYLQRYWSDQLRTKQGFIINTPEAKERSCGIANIGIEGLDPNIVSHKLLTEHKIWTVAIDSAGVKGCRITPNIYTTTEELDQFVQAMETIQKNN